MSYYVCVSFHELTDVICYVLEHSFKWLLSLCDHQELIKTTAEAIDGMCKIHYPVLREYFPSLISFIHSMEQAQNYGPRMEQAAQAIIRCKFFLVF